MLYMGHERRAIWSPSLLDVDRRLVLLNERYLSEFRYSAVITVDRDEDNLMKGAIMQTDQIAANAAVVE